MLRVSDFCRSPLWTVPSSSARLPGRRRRRPNDESECDHSIPGETDGSHPQQAANGDDNDSCTREGEGDCIVSVELTAWNNPAPTLAPSSTSSVRVPLKVLKKLFLRDGDYAFLEKYVTVVYSGDGNCHHSSDEGRSASNSNSNSNNIKRDSHHHDQQQHSEAITVLEKVVVRLRLMQEEEEQRAMVGTYSSRFDSHHADHNPPIGQCLVPSIILANLGISPQGQWEEKPCIARNSNATIRVTERGEFFRLRAIHSDDSDNELSCDESSTCSVDDEGSTMALPLHNTNRNNFIPTISHREKRRRRRRKRVARHVLLRPLGRQSLWPYFPLRGKENGSRGKQESPFSGEPPENNEIPEHIDTESRSRNKAETEDKNNSTEGTGNDDDFWIFPSRSGVPLSVSTLCEVVEHKQDNSGKHNPRQAVHYYYEVLRIRSEDQQESCIDNEEHIVDSDSNSQLESYGEDGDEFFYVTGPSTLFELDSEPISSLSYVRRLPQAFASSNCRGEMIYDNETHLKINSFNAQNESTNERHDSEKQKKMSGNNCLSPSLQRFCTSSTAPLETSSTDNKNKKGETLAEDYAEFNFPPHPDWRQVAEALLHAPSFGEVASASQSLISTSTAATRILHLVGTDREHDLRSCVEVAAKRVGMQCLSVRGLAAFGYQHRVEKGSSNLSKVTVGSPMIEQQLAGIECAFDCIRSRRMEPCVLHFYDVDEELASSTVTGDDDLRCQIEDRFWTKWIDGLSTQRRKRKSIGEQIGLTTPFHNNHEMNDLADYRYTPRVLIVISTTAPLKKGPWLERLIFPTISLSYPDDLYIRYIWNDPEMTIIGRKEKEEQIGSLTAEMMPVLRGRPAHEIFQLRQQMLSEVGMCTTERSRSNSNEERKIPIRHECTTQKLERLCEEFDKGRRKKSSDISSISNVSWQDIGGLDHVRAEIMDAIELPLKYPRLFPKNTGRSGILLFGPPGTGKTLVAKAVASECGLPFLSVKGPELLGSYVGESESNIRKVFASAKQAASNNLPIAASILFFDEMDSLAPRRGEMNHGGGVMERVVASLLAELDGGNIDSSSPEGRVFVLGATNRPDLLDPSLLRPGRLDRLVYLGIPTDHRERTRVLASQLRKTKLDGDAMSMASSVIKRLPPRLSGADMSKLSSGAMLHALRRLCLEAEQEREHRTDGVTVDQILEEWGEEKCTPIITLDDLLVASKDVSPSVSEEEMKRYERLRTEHCSSFQEAKK